MTNVRQASAEDLPAIWDIWWATESASDPDPPPQPPVPPFLRHQLETGTIHVAEQDGRVLGFVSLLHRGGVCYIAEFFVHPHCQSAGVGRTLLQSALPQNDQTICTFSSADFRALSAYVRAGMRPLWPNFQLRIRSADLGVLPEHGLEVVRAEPDDRNLAAWDERTGRRRRPADLAYLTRHLDAVPLWFRRGDRVVGYGYVQMRTPDSVSYPDAATLGPIGAQSPGDAEASVYAAVQWACRRSPVVRIPVPGPHPCLPALLTAGFRMIYIETFVATITDNLPDPDCYIPTLTFF